jgi:hypothetical protein
VVADAKIILSRKVPIITIICPRMPATQVESVDEAKVFYKEDLEGKSERKKDTVDH